MLRSRSNPQDKKIQETDAYDVYDAVLAAAPDVQG